MENRMSLNIIGLFGCVCIPIEQELTAHYEAIKWVDLNKTLKIAMYRIDPATGESVEKPGTTLCLSINNNNNNSILEFSLKKDWLRPEEDEAWRNL